MGQGTTSELPSMVALLRTLPSASAIFDRELRYIAYNDHWREAYRLGGEPLEGRPHYDVFPGLAEQWKELHQRCLAGEVVATRVERFTRGDGSVDYVDYTVAPWRTGSGEIGGLVMHTTVVTERELTTRRLQEANEFVASFFEKSPVGLNLCQLDGLWVESNPAFLDIIGYSAEEADGGLTYWELTPDEYADQEEAQLASLQANGRYGPYEKEFIRKDGRRVPVRLNGFIIEKEGTEYIWSLIEDMTDHHTLQQELNSKRAQILQASKLAALGELAAGVAHELNNPLQIIEAQLFAVGRTVDRGDVPKRESVDAMEHAADRAGRIVHGLRKFARKTPDETALHKAQDLVAEALNLTTNRIRTRGIELNADIEAKGWVECNELKITQVLVNLLNNAFDAVAESRGQIGVSTVVEDDTVTFRVSDSGPGVAEEVAGNVFQPFVTTKPVGRGTGLGLSISHAMVRDAGGTLDYERVDGWTHFVIRLPRGEAR